MIHYIFLVNKMIHYMITISIKICKIYKKKPKTNIRDVIEHTL
jgi:hypothetical protein